MFWEFFHIHGNVPYVKQQAEKLKSREMNEEWWRMNEEWWMMKDEGWMMKDDDFKLLRGLADRQTH